MIKLDKSPQLRGKCGDKKIEDKLKEIRKVLEGDGGGLEVIKYDEKTNILQIKLLGMCQGCPMAEVTVKDFIEKELQKIEPKIKVEKV
ncbi:NifU family protein [bacterium]|nr:NifU family protein [bacterium]